MKIQPSNIKSLLLAGVFALSTGVSAFTALQPSAVSAAGTYTWSGGGSDKKFSTAGNWTGGTVPTDGADLVFPCLQGPVANLENDLTNVRVASISTPVDLEASSCMNMSIDKVDFTDTVTFGGGATGFERKAGVDIQSWTGVNNLTVNGTGVTLVGGANLSSYTVGNMSCGDRSALSSVSTVVKDGYGLNPVGMGDVVFNSGTTMGIASITGNATLSGVYTMKSGSSVGYALACRGSGDGVSNVVISGEMILEGDIPYTLTSNTTVTITGKLSGSGKLVPSANNEGTLINNSSDNSSGTSDGSLSEVKEKTTKLEGISPNENIMGLAKETLILLGERGMVNVPENSILKGTGKAQSMHISGTIAPGLSPGCLTTGAIGITGTYQFELGGTAACAQYDQIIVTGSPDSSTPVVLYDGTAVLSVYGFGSFVQSEGDQFVIIDNRTDKDVNGTFKDLPEGAEVKVGDAVFTISYKGGDGNDVVLTAMNSVKLPGVPNTGIAQIVSANPVLVAISGLLAVGALIFVRRKA